MLRERRKPGLLENESVAYFSGRREAAVRAARANFAGIWNGCTSAISCPPWMLARLAFPAGGAASQLDSRANQVPALDAKRVRPSRPYTLTTRRLRMLSVCFWQSTTASRANSPSNRAERRPLLTVFWASVTSLTNASTGSDGFHLWADAPCRRPLSTVSGMFTSGLPSITAKSYSSVPPSRSGSQSPQQNPRPCCWMTPLSALTTSWGPRT